jgi:hypothetical protein
MCLHRDLKAHIKELTTDPNGESSSRGRYQISTDELIDTIGDPKEISDMYITSVNKVPSLGMRMFLVLGLMMSIFLFYIGLEVLGSAARSQDSSSISSIRPYIYLIGGSIGFGISLVLQWRFRSMHFIVPFYCMYLLAIANPISVYMANVLSQGYDIEVIFIIANQYHYLFLLQIVLIAIIGLYISMRHYQVFTRKSMKYI